MDDSAGLTTPAASPHDARRSHVVASQALERGTKFLVSNQGTDGLWRDFLTPAGEASEWPTGFVGTALHLAAGRSHALERAADALAMSQNADGGWGYNESVPTDADSTAWVLLLLGLMGRRGDRCLQAASCLVRHQRTEDGGIATYCDADPIRRFMGVSRWMRFKGWCNPHTEVTAVTGRALAALVPGRGSPEAAAAWRYVRSQQDVDGSWSSYWWTSPHYTTLQAVELAVSFGDFDRARRAAEWAIRSQRRDGGWTLPDAGTSAFATAMCLSVLVLSGASGEPVARAISKLGALQQEDGGWPSHPIMRIPLPGDSDPDHRGRWRPVRFDSGVVVSDQHRTFTSAACIAALARASDATHP